MTDVAPARPVSHAAPCSSSHPSADEQAEADDAHEGALLARAEVDEIAVQLEREGYADAARRARANGFTTLAQVRAWCVELGAAASALSPALRARLGLAAESDAAPPTSPSGGSRAPADAPGWGSGLRDLDAPPLPAREPALFYVTQLRAIGGRLSLRPAGPAAFELLEQIAERALGGADTLRVEVRLAGRDEDDLAGELRRRDEEIARLRGLLARAEGDLRQVLATLYSGRGT